VDKRVDKLLNRLPLSIFLSLLLLLLVSLLLGMLGTAAHATATLAAADPVLEKHVLAISEELRCLVCQNQTIADSHADLAIDLRNQVREKLQAGYSDRQVIDFMVARYGDFVLYRPPVKATTWFLWFGPFALLLGGLIFLGMKLRQQRAPSASGASDVPSASGAQPPVSEAQMQRAAALLSGAAALDEPKEDA
jgi:cytochrome c-type biogenesis protein CcmH